jgi:hypothetical protein
MQHHVGQSLWTFFGLFIGLCVFPSAQAHLHDRNVPPCFEMRDDKVHELPNTSGDNFIRFGRIEFTPANGSQLAASEYLYITVRVTGKLCSPYMVFLYPQTREATPLVVGSRPSLAHPGGSIDKDFTQFVTLSVDEKNIVPGATGTISSVRLRIVQYGSHKEYAQIDIPVTATWRAPSRPTVQTFPEYECIDAMRLPPAVVVPTRCANSIDAPAGSRRSDLNQDGICEVFVRDEVCDQTHGNLCYRVMAERNGAWQPITVFWNELTEHSSESGYRSLSYVVHGPLSEMTSFIEWTNDTYLTHNYLHKCSLVPK